MISALILALTEILDPRLRRALAASLLGALAALAILGGGLAYLVHHAAFFEGARFFGAAALARAVDVLGGLAALGLAWLLFPAVATAILGLFLDEAIALVEERRYPGLPSPRRQKLGEQVAGGLRLAALGIVVNLAALPLYLLLPGLNLVVYYGFNGWLLGREYFELVGQRRLDRRQVRAVWRAHFPYLVAGGVVIAVLMTLPVVNLAAPLIGALFMLHLFEGLRQGKVALLGSY